MRHSCRAQAGRIGSRAIRGWSGFLDGVGMRRAGPKCQKLMDPSCPERSTTQHCSYPYGRQCVELFNCGARRHCSRCSLHGAHRARFLCLNGAVNGAPFPHAHEGIGATICTTNNAPTGGRTERTAWQVRHRIPVIGIAKRRRPGVRSSPPITSLQLSLTLPFSERAAGAKR
jgi:hypothetical protein